MKERFILPAALQLILDDIGWFYGGYGRFFNDAARTSMPRRHCLADYEWLETLGKRIGQRIHGMFVIGDWDKDGILAGVPNSNPMGDAWTGSKYLRMEEAEEIRDFVNGAKYLELGMHGLLHDVWKDGVNLGNAEFFPPKDFVKGQPQQLAQPDYLRKHFDAFFKLYNDWGFRAPIRSFASPCGECGAHLRNDLQPILREYGIEYWANHTHLPHPVGTTVHSGIIFSRKEIELVHYAAYDVDPDRLPLYKAEEAGIIGGHWPNVLRWDPENNAERLENWAAFFERQCRVFGIMLSRDIGFAHQQMLYRNMGAILEEDGKVIIDLTAADEAKPLHEYEPVYVSVRNGTEIVSVEGAAAAPWEQKPEFYTVRLERVPGVHRIAITAR